MNDLIIVLGIPLVRNLAGWAENALRDKKVSKYEWQQLAETSIKLGVPGLLLYYGIDMPAEMAGSLPALVDYVFSLFAKKVAK